MKATRPYRLILAASLAGAAGLPVSVLAQEAPPPAPASSVPADQPVASAPPPPAPQPQPAAPGEGKIRFNFSEAPFDQVIKFFERESGLPIIREAPEPQATMTFISGEAYSFDEALTILNLNLQAHGVQLRREKEFLYLASLKEAARKPGDVVHGDVPAGARPDQILTLTIPLSNAKAALVAEQVKPLLGPFGSAIAVEAQNLLIVTESVAQCRRIRQIVQAVDEVRPVDSAFRVFPLKHAKCEAVHAALNGLLGERTRTVIIDKDGQQRVVNDLQVSGLNLQPDPRTNSIIAVGAENRIKTVEEVIALLDVPEGAGGERQMMTFSLATVSPAEAAKNLNDLFATVPAERKPTVLPLADSGKITVVASLALLTQAASLLGEIDPGFVRQDGTHAAPTPERRAAVIRLTHIAPAAIEALAPRLLTARQMQVVKFAPLPDGKGLVVAGPDADVSAFEKLVAGLDVPREVDKEVRQVRLGAGGADPAGVLARAQALDSATGRDRLDPVIATLDAQSRTVTLIGGRGAIERFAELLRSTEASTPVDLETRTFQLTRARPSVLAAKAARVARPLLAPDDGAPYAEPRLEPVDELSTLVVHALPGQMGVLEQVIQRLDAEEPGAVQFRVLKVGAADPQAVLDRAMALYQQQTQGLPPDQAGAVKAEVDRVTGAILVTAGASGMRHFTELVTQVQLLTPPLRTTRLVDVQNVKAAAIVGELNQFLASADPIDPSRKVPDPTIRVIESSNSLLVTAEDAQHRLIQDYVARLDRLTPTDLPPLKLLQLRAADVNAVAAMLNEQYAKRAQSERAARPVEVRADPATSTLIVSAHPDLFEEIKTLVNDLNKEQREGPERVTQSFPLKVARAEAVAQAMDKLYPQPPMPMDRLNRPQPWLQKPKEVTVSADPGTNTLIIDAPADRMESIQALAEKLDRAELPPVSELKTYRIIGGNLDAISKTLNGLRAQLAGPAQPGKPQVQVLIETEPKSQTLIVAGDETTFKQVEAILKDLSAVPAERGLRVIPVANVDAAQVRDRALAIYNAQVAAIPGATPAEVTIDTSSNSLMVVADNEGMQRFLKIMDELQRQAGAPREIRMIELKSAKADQVRSFLDDLVKSSESFRIKGGADPVFETIEATNSIMVAAQPSQFAIIEMLAKSLDNQQSADRPPTRILKLRTTDAANLATVLQLSYDRRPVEKRNKQPVDIQADAATNTLIVSAHPEVLPEIEQIVTELNETQAVDAEGREIRIFPLKIARAEELARTIDTMYPQPPVPLDPRTRQPRPDLQPPREVVVRADRATNALIVDAPAKRLAGFEQIVKSLDQQKLADNVEVRTFRVARADLGAVATTLKNLAATGAIYGSGGASVNTPVTIDTEPSTRTLIVSGPTPVFAAVDEVLKKLDSAPERPATGVKMYAMRHARADRIGPLVQKVLLGRVREMQQAPGATVVDPQQLVEVAADAGSNSIVVTAPESVLPIADALVETLDQAAVATAVELRVYHLKRGDAASVANTVRSALSAEAHPGDAPATVSAEPASNSIVVVGTTAQLDRATKLIESMDVAMDRDGMGVKTIYLKHGRAEAIAPVVQTVLQKQSVIGLIPSSQLSQYLARTGGNLGDQVKVASEKRLNAIVISAPTAILDLAEQVVTELDADPATLSGRAERAVRVIPLTNADATELSANLQAVFADDQTQDEPPTIRVDRASNSLIIRASDSQMATVEALAQRLDSATLNTSRQLRMIPVDRSRADAAVMAETLRRLLEQQGGVKVEVISAQELLRATEPAPEEKPAPPRSDAAPSPALDSPATTRLAHGSGGWTGAVASAYAMWTTMAMQPEPPAAEQPAVVQPANPPAPVQPEETPGVTIAVDPATNSLIVVGSPRLTDRLVALAAQLERQMPAEPTKVRIVQLPDGADAQSLAQVVNQTVQQLGRASAGNPGGFTGAVSVSPDPSGAALIVWANDTDFASIGQLIGAVSRLDSAAVSVKIYPLTSISAQRAVAAVNDLLSLQPRGFQARRLRGTGGPLTVSLLGPDGTSIETTIDPAQIRLTADPNGAAVLVAAPSAAIPLLDRFIGMLDQSPEVDRLAIRRYDLHNARAQDLGSTLQALFDAQRQGPGREDTPAARFVPDSRTNSLLVTASEAQHADVTRLLGTMDASMQDADGAMEIIALRNASPTTVQQVVEQVVLGRDPGRKDKVLISAQNDSNLFVVRAPKDLLEDIKAVVAQVDTADVGGLPIRSIKLERADAQTVATVINQFYRDRAAASSGRRAVSRVAVAGDRRSGTLIVTAADADFEQVSALAATFDAPSKGKEMQYRIIPLQNARVTDLEETVQSIASELQFERTGGGWWWGPRNDNQDNTDDKLFVQTNERINAVVVMGQGDTLQTMLKIIAELDKPQAEQTRLVVKAVPVERADLNSLAGIIRSVTETPGWRSWRGRDPDAVEVQVDAQRRLLLLIGKQPRVEQAVAYLEELKSAQGRPGQQIESVSLKHAQADRAAMSLRRFLTDRAAAGGLPADSFSVVGSVDGNVLIVSADPETMTVVRDLVAQIDQPEMSDSRRREVYVLRNGKADEIATMVRSQFPRAGRADAQILVTPQPSTNSLVVSAPADDFDAVEALVKQLDSMTMGDVRIATVNLKTGRAAEVADALKTALPANVTVKVTPVPRNNTILLTGSAEAIALAMEQINKIDSEPARSLVEFRRVKLKNAIASDVSWTLRQMLRARPKAAGDADPGVDYTTSDNTVSFSGTTDQVRDIEKMIETLDVPSDVARSTEFVKLEFARAEQVAEALDVFYGPFAMGAQTPGARNVTIVPDPASNSLVISAEQAEWEGIRALLKKLDTEEYDTSQQLAVIPLKHADARSVAQALNEGFRAPIEDTARREQIRTQGRGAREDAQPAPPTVLIDTAGRPTVSAEVQTNSLIIFAGRRELDRIRKLVEQIDVPDFVKFPDARIIPLAAGKASLVAASVRDLFANPNIRPGGPRSVVIIGDDSSNSLIVRADDAEFAQIKALADTIQQQVDAAGVTVRVMAVKNVPAARLQRAVTAAFAQSAKEADETLAVEVDRSSNSLVIASSQRLFEEIQRVVGELDAVLPRTGPGGPAVPGGPLGQSVFIIDVQNNSPEDVRKMLEQLGLTKPAADDRQGVVSEPVTVIPLSSRRALAVVASPVDGESVVALVRALDAEPAHAEQQVAVVSLKTAAATPVVNTLKAMLSPANQAADTAPAKAIAEQLRRLSLIRTGVDQANLTLDLSKPIRLIADEQTNSIIVSSTKENLPGLLEVVHMLDALPIGDAVVIRIFPLQNASAARVKTVVDELFKQGEALRRLPGTTRQGLPTTATGKALAGEIAIAIDDRTNTLIAAGREEAVALLEVLVKDMDSDESSKWIEPLLLPLKHADAVALSSKLRQVLVQGLTATPEAIGLQKQYGRLRMAIAGRDPIQADLFAPLTGLVIVPEEQLNALVIVGTAANTAVVKELVAQLDVESAAASNTVRVFPLEHAAADRIASIVADVFKQRDGLPGNRPEDRLIITADARTNALIATTSPRSFSILETLLKTLDAEEARYTVGLHVIPVTGADASVLAPKIADLMRQRIAGAQQSGSVRSPLDTFSIEADKANNLLIVAASDENLKLVQELVDALSRGNPALLDSVRTDLIQLKGGTAAEVAQTLADVYVDRENARRGAGSVTVVPNERLNALVVTGTQDDIDAIRRHVESLESAQVIAVQDVRAIELNSANALEVASLVRELLAGRPVGGSTGGKQATTLRFVRDKIADELEGGLGVKPTETQVDEAVRDQIRLTPDLRTNSVWITAPADVMPLLREIVAQMDSTKRDRRIETFALKNADARDTAELLRDVFNLRQQGNMYVLIPTNIGPEERTPDEQAGSISGSTVTPVPDERQQLSIAIDARTNTLVVSGTEEYLRLVGELIGQLDGIQATERERIVYHLRNAKAKDVEENLSRLFQSESDIQREILGPDMAGSAVRQLEREVTVVGDEKSNKVIVTVAPRYSDRVMELVQELDTSPPQVMIQVLLAEVTLDNSETWGVDFRLKDFGGDNYNFGSAALGSGVAAALGIPNLALSSTDFTLLVRALEAQGKLQVLSRPSVTVNNNEKGFIQVGDDIAIVTGVDKSLDTGRSSANVERRDVGIILNVTPTISDDGFVRMQLEPEISTLSARTTQISEDFQAPIINKRTVQTVVTVKDGQTVVIGGLIQTTQDERRTKVPIVGDIPGIGLLFRTTNVSNVKTELLVILTPKVIYTDDGAGVARARDLSEQKIDALSDPDTIRDTLLKDGAYVDPVPRPRQPGGRSIGPASPQDRR